MEDDPEVQDLLTSLFLRLRTNIFNYNYNNYHEGSSSDDY